MYENFEGFAEEDDLEAELIEKQEQLLLPESPETRSVTAVAAITQKKLLTRRKLLLLLAKHLQNFQRAILTSRRRCQQRQRRRQAFLRAFYVQQLLELETSYLEMLPLPGMHDLKAVPEEGEGEWPKENGHHTMNDSNKLDENDFGPDGMYEHAQEHFSDVEWLETFRMSRHTFRWLCDQMRDTLQADRGSLPSRNLISLEKRVAVGVYAMATGTDYRIISLAFKICRASVCKFMKRFADALVEKLGDTLLAMPRQAQEYDEIRANFRKATNMPASVVGVLGVWELTVSLEKEKFKPAGAAAREDGEAMVILQTLIDDRLLFRKVQVEMPRPTLFLEAPNAITQLKPQLINGRSLPCFVVSPPSPYYPLRPWLMRHYEEPSDPHHHDFNEAIDNLQVFRQQAFRRLFGRWHILQRKADLEPRTMHSIALASCALHNLLEECDEDFNEAWAENVILQQVPNFEQVMESPLVDAEEAIEMRDFLARTISSTEM